MNSKPWWQSKTLWVNGLTTIVAVLTTLGGSELVSSNPQIAAGLVVAVGVVNMALRVITSLPLGG